MGARPGSGPRGGSGVRREDGGPARLARAVALPAKASAMTGSTWVPVLPKWGAGIRPGTVPSSPSRLGPGSPTFWPRALLSWALPPVSACRAGPVPPRPSLPAARPGRLTAPSATAALSRAGGVFSLARRPCQKHLVYKLAAASRLPPHGCGRWADRAEAPGALPPAPGAHTARVHPWPPAHDRAGRPLLASQPGSSEGPRP